MRSRIFLYTLLLCFAGLLWVTSGRPAGVVPAKVPVSGQSPHELEDVRRPDVSAPVAAADDPELEADSELERSTPRADVSNPEFARKIRAAQMTRAARESTVQPSPSAAADSAREASGLEVLRELQEAEERTLTDSGRIYGGRVRRGSSGEDQGEENEESLDEDPSLPFYEGQARGYTMLAAMHPKARAVTEQQLRALLRSRVKQAYLGILVDGTFRSDVPYVRSLIERLVKAGRSVLLVLYLSNGASMRTLDTGVTTMPFIGIDPLQFRDRIRFDARIRNRFQRIVRESRELFEFNLSSSRDNANIAIVMLEDNLTKESYGAMRNLAQAELKGVVRFVRNPCLGCFEGNDADSLGDGEEVHTVPELQRLGPGDGFSLDGVSFSYFTEPPAPAPRFDEVQAMMTFSILRQVGYFGLWRFNWQGVDPVNPPLNPDERQYIPSTEEQVDEEVVLLRHGLTEVAPVVTPVN